MDNITDDGQLIAEARSNPAAFTQLYRRHYGEVFRYCSHRLFDRQSAEDMTSQVFLKVVEKFHSFEGNEKQFRNWLYKIAINAVNNHLRKTARRDVLIKYACRQADNPDSTDTPAEKLAVLKQAMLTLKPQYQTIITLRFFENLNLTEIAEVLGSSDGTVRSQLARALNKLRRKINVSRQEVS